MGYDEIRDLSECATGDERCTGNWIQICKAQTWTNARNCNAEGMTCAFVDGEPVCKELFDAGPDSGVDAGTDTDTNTDTDTDSDAGTTLRRRLC